MSLQIEETSWKPSLKEDSEAKLLEPGNEPAGLREVGQEATFCSGLIVHGLHPMASSYAHAHAVVLRGLVAHSRSSSTTG